MSLRRSLVRVEALNRSIHLECNQSTDSVAVAGATEAEVPGSIRGSGELLLRFSIRKFSLVARRLLDSDGKYSDKHSRMLERYCRRYVARSDGLNSDTRLD